jgi:hypothetical protein
MSIRVQELSILQEIAYLDPDFDGEIMPLERDWARPAWFQLRQLFSSPCVLALGVFTALMIVGVLLAD